MRSIANQYRGSYIKAIAPICAAVLALLPFIALSRTTAEAVNKRLSREDAYRASHQPELPGINSVDQLTPSMGRVSKRLANQINWRLEKTTGNRPSARGGGKMVAVGNRLV
ncbi:MAG TPA: hypothetical protein VFQ43_11540, partial [Nitrososphaera sp.]|nr:hypothetical protein [Nitrososphaera sp.]